MKFCSKCSLEKSLDSFYKDNSRPDGLYGTCKDCKKLYRDQNKEHSKNWHKLNYQRNRDKIDLSNNNWKKKNPNYYKSEYFINKAKENRLKNKEKRNEQKLEYYYRDKENKSGYYLSIRVRNRIRAFLKLKGLRKTKNFPDYIGCTSQELKLYLESKFTEGMNWDLLIKGQIHIDHIIPLCTANSEEEIYKLCHYTNLQPLWAIDNLKKGKKWQAV